MQEELRYPIGKFQYNADEAKQNRAALIEKIAEVPAKLRNAVNGLSEEQLQTPYRPAGWTVKQTVHHVADSHMNSFVRFKLALTETIPPVKPYEESLWAELPDGKDVPVEFSLMLIEGLHKRWETLLRSLKDDDFGRQLTHPEHGLIDLNYLVALYAWHGEHHIAHITNLRQRMNWL